MTGIGQKGFKIALLKLSKGFNKTQNVRIAMSEIHRAKKNGAQLIVLPECFNSPYGTDYFEDYAEEVPSGSTCRALARTAAESNVCVVGGTVPEKYGNKVYNTCTVWSNRGKLLAIHRQMHFIEVDTPNTQNLNKTNVLSTGDEITTFEYEGTKIGIGISHDLFFPELAHLMSKQGCSLLVYLGAFGKIMGVEPTQVFARSRAGDEQLWVALASSADACLMLVDPRATVVARTERQILIADIDLNLVEEVRRQISIRAQKIDGYTVHVKACCKFPVSS
ncbi:omega-amidase NIT2-like [Melitaea cinxia]|uniref:omega-amidase NIT2-like n=1 Tax=Melitaea cinxia TaxID=113334 RepID=UPI001E271754|nr:omega-amidase NIT2-like [Melitaea cinxia]